MTATAGILASFVPFINLYLASAIKHNIILKFAKTLDKESDEALAKNGGERILGTIGIIIFCIGLYSIVAGS